jgi:hypothetical protein
MANEFVARKGLVVLTNGATITGSLNVQGNINATGYNITASNYTGSFRGDGSQLTGITATNLDIDTFGSDLTGITVAGTDKLIISDAGTEGRINVSQLSTPLAGTGLEANAGTIRIAASAAGNGLTGGAGSALAVGAGNGITVNADDVALNTGSVHFEEGVRKEISSANTTGAGGINLTYNQTTGIISGSVATPSTSINGTTINLGGTHTITANTTNALTLGNGLTGTSFNGGTAVTTNLDTGSGHFISGTRALISIADTTGAGGIDLTYNQTTGVISGSLVNSSLTVSAGNGLSGGGAVSLGGTTTITLDTSSAHFTGGVKTKLNTDGVFSSSAQINASQIPGNATTGSNTFTGVQTISDTTNSTLFSNGALVVAGGVGIGKDVNISGSLTINGLLTVTSQSVQYVTSSQLVVADNRIIVNVTDLQRFGGLSVIDSGSSSPATASIYWDSLNHKFIYENLSGSAYNSAMFIGGPTNNGALGNEVGLTVGRVPVASGDDHIDSRPQSSSIRVDFPSKLTHIEAGVYVTGSVSSSVGFSGDGSNLTGIVTNLNISGSGGGSGSISLKTQNLTVSGSNGVVATMSGQTLTVSGSDATTTTKGVASFNSTNFTVTNGAVTSNNISINGTNVTLGGTRNITLQQITTQGSSSTDQIVLNGGVIIQGVLYTTGSNPDVDTGTEVVATVATGSYDAAFFDYVVKKATNYRAGTVTAVWDSSTANVEFTDVSTTDIGNTTDVTLSVDILSGVARLKATTTTDNWVVKSVIRAL